MTKHPVFQELLKAEEAADKAAKSGGEAGPAPAAPAAPAPVPVDVSMARRTFFKGTADSFSCG